MSTSAITPMQTEPTHQTGRARPVDRGSAVATLVAAFSADPVMRWLYPTADSYFQFFPRLVEILGGDAFAARTAAVAQDHSGAALWLAPDVVTDDEQVERLFAESLAPHRAGDVVELLEQVLAHHPTDPLWYLPLIGVDPIAQGRGIGSRLLRAGLARADRDGLPAYLEASTPQNRALYQRHGFVVQAEVRAADAPPLWPMLRPARVGSGR